MKNLFIIVFIVSNFNLFSQEAQPIEQNININKFISGTLLLPNSNEKPVLAIIIADSGPTDRNGNQNFNNANTLKKLAVGLAANQISTFRYDKRIVKQIRQGRVDKDMSFHNFIEDAISVIDFFKNNEKFKRIYVIGHGQGSLVGIVASQGRVDGFISLAGSGKSIDDVILDQIELTAPIFTEAATAVFSKLKKGETTKTYPEALSSIFSIDLQPFMSSWMYYHPHLEIAKLEIPTLIICGTKDLQVNKEEAKLLSDAAQNSELRIIEKMNHILVPIDGDDLENSKSYNETYRKLSPEVVASITGFIY